MKRCLLAAAKCQVNLATLLVLARKGREERKIRVERANKELGSTADPGGKGARKCIETVLARTNLDANTVRSNGICGPISKNCCDYFKY